MLQEKARQIAEALDLSQEDFKASNGWRDRFKNRNGIKAKCISGEAGGVSEDTVESWRERLKGNFTRMVAGEHLEYGRDWSIFQSPPKQVPSR